MPLFCLSFEKPFPHAESSLSRTLLIPLALDKKIVRKKCRHLGQVLNFNCLLKLPLFLLCWLEAARADLFLISQVFVRIYFLKI